MKKALNLIFTVAFAPTTKKVIDWFAIIAIAIILYTILDIYAAIISALLFIHFCGFLFLSAESFKRGEEWGRILSFKTFFTGFKVFIILYISLLPIILLNYFTKASFVYIFDLFYIMFIPVTLLLQMVYEYPKWSIKRSWEFFKKNASKVFAFTFWTGVIFFLTTEFEHWAQTQANIYSTSEQDLILFIGAYILIALYFIFMWSALIGVTCRFCETKKLEK